MSILSHDEILVFHKAIISAGLVESRAALLAGLDPRFVAGLPKAATPSDQILRDLDALNVVGELADGSRPLSVWLTNATALAAPRTEADLFRYLGAVRNLVGYDLDSLAPRGADAPAGQLHDGLADRTLAHPAIAASKRAYKLDPMYINIRRVAVLAGAELIVGVPPNISEKEADILRCVRFAAHLRRWLDRAGDDVGAFLKDRSQGRLVGGRIFTVHRWFKFRDARGIKKGDGPLAYTTFPDPSRRGEKVRIELRIEPSHVVTGSPGDLMTGTVSDVFVCAMVFGVEPRTVTAVPIFIGHKMTQGAWGQVLPAPRS